MEYGLRPHQSHQHQHFNCLNPCCNGIWSQTLFALFELMLTHVLILVVMEYGLRPYTARKIAEKLGLNPCCNGIWSQT